MRVILAPAALAAALIVVPAAFAAQTATGSVKAFDMAHHTLTLNDGTVYQLSSKFKDPGLKAGEKVTISWDMKDGKYQAESVKIVK